MAKRRILTTEENSKIEAYRETGRSAFVKHKRDGRCLVSLNGFSAVNLEVALQKIDEHLSEI